MKKLSSSLLLMLISIASIAIFGSKVLAQQETGLPPKLNSDSSLGEILEWLNQNAFPYARVGLRTTGGTGPKRSFGLPRESAPSGERFFSEGFHIKWVNGCHVTLSNEHPMIIDARNRSSGHFRRFIPQKNGTRELTPQLALLFLPLNRMSEKRGKGPYLHSKDQEKAKLPMGPWRTSFDQIGFFRRSIFELELTATEQPQTKELGRFGYLTFTFDSKELAEQFNAAFRLAIRTCNSK